MDDSLVAFDNRAIKSIAVLAAAVIVLVLSRILQVENQGSEPDDVALLGVVAFGLIVAHHLVVESRLFALGLGALTAGYSVIGGGLLLDTRGWLVLFVGLLLIVAIVAAAGLAEGVPPGLLAFVPLFVLGVGANLPPVVVGALLGVAGVVLILESVDSPPQPVPAQPVEVAMAPAAIEFAGVAADQAETVEVPVVRETSDPATRSRWAPADLEQAELEQRPVPPVASFAPMESAVPVSGDFHLVLGQPSRADGLPGELSVMPVPFTAGSESDSFTAGDWHLQARSSRGSSHVHGGEPRQDTYAMSKSTDERFVIVAVADGLGSAERSNFGSYWATRLAVATLARELGEAADVVALLRELPVAIASKMDGLGEQLIRASGSQIAATLVIAVVPLDRPAPIWLARVGDSDALVLTGSGQWASGFGASDDGDVETGTTNVLPIHPTSVEVRTIDGSKVRSLLLATDGVSRVIEGSPDLVGATFAERLAEPVDSIEFQRIVDFRRRGAHDDRTVVALWHRGEGENR